MKENEETKNCGGQAEKLSEGMGWLCKRCGTIRRQEFSSCEHVLSYRKLYYGSQIGYYIEGWMVDPQHGSYPFVVVEITREVQGAKHADFKDLPDVTINWGHGGNVVTVEEYIDKVYKQFR